MDTTRDNGLGPTPADPGRQTTTLLWVRRDLRLGDNPALVAAVALARRGGGRLLPVFIWEPRERRRWAPGAAARWWLWTSLTALDEGLRRRGSRLALGQGDPAVALPALARAANAGAVVWAAGLEPDELADDAAVSAALAKAGVEAVLVPSAALLYDPMAVRTREGRPYTVFTPYWRACLSRGAPATPVPLPDPIPPPPPVAETVTLAALRSEAVRPWAAGFGEVWKPGETGAHESLGGFLQQALATYADDRDRPAIAGTSRLSPHLHWGEVSARQVWHAVTEALAVAGLELEPALKPSEKGARADDLQRSAGAFVRQLGWREFAHHVLLHFPHSPEHPLQQRFAAFPWRDDLAGLEAWQRGHTGYRLVDAGMRQLWTTGWMHNRARLVAASFLVKDLLLPWRLGEDWFWETLVDADLANNALGWQWVAGCGADAAPYFRILNPETQSRRFDSDDAYARRWLRQPVSPAGAETHLEPIVDHGEARSRALAAYAAMRDATR